MSFKIPCGGFKLDEKLFSLDKNDVLSIPKPLTYDYMPEGYPSKSIETVTLMEEQEVAFSDTGGGGYGAVVQVPIELQEGQTYKVIWDGTEYSVVAANGAIGNMAFMGGEDTGEPFIYVDHMNGVSVWMTADTSASHTISVTGIKVEYIPMNANFMPVATEKTYGAVKTSDFIKMATLKGKMDKETVYKYAKEFEDGHIRLLIDNGRSTVDISSISKYGTTGAGEIFEVYTARAPYCKKRYACDNYGQYNFSSIGTPHPTSADAFLEKIRLHSQDNPNDTSGVVLSAKGSAYDTFLDIGGIGIIMQSSTKGSLKKFKITVDDSGTLSATEVT